MADFPDLTASNAAQRARYSQYPTYANASAPPAANNDNATIDSTNAALRAQFARTPVTVGKPPSPVLNAVGRGLSAVLGIGDAEASRYPYPNAAPTLFPDVGAANRGPGPNYPPPGATAAAQAARAAAMKAGSNYSNEGRQPVNTTMPTPVLDHYNNGTQFGPPQPLPGWDKAAGMEAIAQGGSPRLLNYGPGSTVVGSSTNGSKKFNSFTDVVPADLAASSAGANGVPATGGRVPGGAGNSGNPYDALRSHISEIIAQHDRLNNDGTLTGALKAHGLRSYLSRLGPIAQSESQHQYQMGQIGVAQRRVNLEEQQAGPDIAIKNLVAAQIGVGNLAQAGKTARVAKGGEQTAVQNVPAFGYTRDPDTGDFKWHGFQGSLPQ